MIRICSRSSSVAASTRSTVRSKGGFIGGREPPRGRTCTCRGVRRPLHGPRGGGGPGAATGRDAPSQKRLGLGKGRKLGAEVREDGRALVAHQRRDLAAPLRTAEHAD